METASSSKIHISSLGDLSASLKDANIHTPSTSRRQDDDEFRINFNAANAQNFGK